MSVFNKDPEIQRDFVMLRTLLIVTFGGLGLLWFTFAGWVVWRLGPGGYSAYDAQKDRIALCRELDRNFEHALGWNCPPIEESGENGD